VSQNDACADFGLDNEETLGVHKLPPPCTDAGLGVGVRTVDLAGAGWQAGLRDHQPCTPRTVGVGIAVAALVGLVCWLYSSRRRGLA